jgi:hypothetical protein
LNVLKCIIDEGAKGTYLNKVTAFEQVSGKQHQLNHTLTNNILDEAFIKTETNYPVRFNNALLAGD